MNGKKNASPAQAKNELVFIENDKPITTSRLIARTFGKQHAHVLRDLQNLGCSAEFTESNFGLTSYKDKSGKENKEYHITKDGFTMLAFGYTGEKAMKFKEDYIKRFNLMENELRETTLQNLLPQSASKPVNEVYSCQMGDTMTDCYYTDGIIYTRFSKLLSFIGNSSGTTPQLREKCGSENFIERPIYKQSIQFGNQKAFENFCKLSNRKPSSAAYRTVMRDVFGVDIEAEPQDDDYYTYKFTDREIKNIYLEISRSPIRKGKVIELLELGNREGGQA